MKTVLKLVVLAAVCGILYKYTFVGDLAVAYWEAHKAAKAEEAYNEAAAKVARDNAPETSFDEDGDYHPRRNPSGMSLDIHDTDLIDEDGYVVKARDIINENPGKIVVFHAVSPNTPKRDDEQQEHFDAVMRLQEEHPDEVVVYGLNPWKPRNLVKDFKERFGLDYEVLSVPLPKKGMSKEYADNYNGFNNAICGGDHTLCPYSVVYIKDGYVVEIISGTYGYEALEDKLYAAMAG